MSDTPFEIHDDEINVEEIMQKIRDNIRRRKEAGLLPPDPDAMPAQSDPLPSSPSEYSRDLSYLSGNWDIQNRGYFISSHRPHVGKFLVKGRELVHGEVRRYVDPMIWRQTEFNRATASTLEGVTGHLDRIDHQLNELETLPQQLRNDLCHQIHGLIKDVRSQFNISLQGKEDGIRNEFSQTLSMIQSEIQEIVTRLKKEIHDELKDGLIDREQLLRDEFSSSSVQLKNDLTAVLVEKEHLLRDEFSSISDMIRSEMNEFRFNIQAEIAEEVKKQVESTLLAMDDDIEKRTWLAKVLEGRISSPHLAQPETESPPTPDDTGINYFVFEDRFRGTRGLIKDRQKAFLKYFEGCRNVLDIGCGRGEFLELMREQGIGARGVDLDETMVDYCRSRGLEVERNDALTYIEQLEDASLDGIFIDQVVEHLEPAYLVRLLELCHQKMKYGFYLVAETVNPLSFTSFANFYIDLTHVRPVHPETLRFLFGTAGFREIDMQFFTPISDDSNLKKMPVDLSLSEVKQQMVEIHNQNVDLLNWTIYGPMDYAIVGKK